MEKNLYSKTCAIPIGEGKHRKWMRIMKLNLWLLLICLNLSATVHSQQMKVSLELEEVSLADFFKAVKQKTGYSFLYNSRILEGKGNISLHVSDEMLDQLLFQVLDRNGLTYTLQENVIVVTTKQAQSADRLTVRGTVRDATGRPVPGVTVLVKGTSFGVATDNDGKYTLTFPRMESSPVLIFSFVGMETREVPYTGRETVDVVMKDAESEIDEIVVTGYQKIAREKVTGAVTTISAADLAERYTPNLLDNLEGRVAGLMVYNGGMQIRGTGSIYAERSPLLVIDGLPVEGSIEDINPYDIESVTVLKDAAAAAIYGARASNGILVITTKRASRSTGKIDVDVSVNFTVYEKRNVDYHDNFYMNAREQVDAEMANWQNYFFDDPTTSVSAVNGTESSITSGYFSISPIQYAYYQLASGAMNQSQFDNLMEEYRNNDFAKEYSRHILRNRILQQYNVAVRSASERFSSSLVLNYRHDNNGIIKSGEDKFTAFYKGTYDMARWLTVNFGVNTAFGKETENSNSFATNPFNVPAYQSLLKPDGSYNNYSYGGSLSNHLNALHETEPGLRSNHFNHLQEMDYGQRNTRQLNARLQGELLFKVMEGVTVNTQFIYEAERYNRSTYLEAESYVVRTMRNAYTQISATGTYTYLIPEHGGMLTTRDTRGDYWTARGQVNFNRAFGKHNIDFLAGLEFRQTYSKGTNGLLMGYDDQLQSHATFSVDYPFLESYTYSNVYGGQYPARQFYYSPYIASGISPVREQRHRYASGYANLTYTYNNRYNLFGSFRSDYADIYGLDTKFRGKPLWSVGASWNIDREAFMKKASPVDMLKLRVSYGVTGNIYQGATSFLTATTGTINSLTGQPISVVSSPANPELKWEQTATINVGADFALLRNRVRGSIDWYNKKGTDIFANKLLEDSKGFASMAMNAASLINNGVEVTLTADWFRAPQQGGFSWTTSATFSHNKNEITEVDTPATRAYELISTPYKKGYPVSALFSYDYAGLAEDGSKAMYWQNDTVKSSTIASAIPDALVFSGQSDPQYTFGMENRFRYRHFSLNVMMVYYGGHKQRMRQIGEMPKSSMGNGLIDVARLDSWTPTNTDTDIPGMGQYGHSSTSSEYQSSSLFVHSGDFLKIRNIVLGYDLPHNLLSKVGFSHAALRFQIDNPKALYIANDVGVDPETGGIRKQTSYIIGLNISF